MSIADEFIAGGMSAKQTTDMGVMLGFIYQGALKSTSDPKVAENVTQIFIQSVLRQAQDQTNKNTGKK